MKQRWSPWLVPATVGALLAGCAVGPVAPAPGSRPARHTAQAESSVPVERFAMVNDPRHPALRVYRGGFPSDEALRRLDALGVEVIVNLQYPDENPAALAHEQEVARSLGMNFVNLPLNDDGTPPPATLERFFQLARTSGDDPLFVHCLYGRDRTGAVIAAYRIHEDDYTAEQALAEMESFGYSPAMFPALEAFVRRYAQNHD